MMQDPKMRDVMKAQARMGIDMMYRDLYDLLNLPEPKRSELQKLISEKTSAAMEIGFSALGSKKTPEELKAISDELKSKTAALDSQIKGLLGDEDYGQLKRYEDSTNERMHLQTLNSMLASKNIEMDEATESRLMDVMYEERKKLPFINTFTDQQNTDMTRFTPDNLAQFGSQYEQLNQSVVTRAGGILSPAQLEVFQQSQDQMGAMTKMHLDMAAKMFGAQE
jgi:hypothetical protein